VRMQATKPPDFPSKPIDFQHFIKAVPRSILIEDFENILFKGSCKSILFNKKFDCLEGQAQISSLVHMPKYRLRPYLYKRLQKHLEEQTERSIEKSMILDM
jgi:hypothetical protein